MRLAVAIALTILYVGISLAIAWVHPENALWAFFPPVIVTTCAVIAAERISAALPVPWPRTYGPPLRRIHLSWRAAVRVPAMLPWLVFPWLVFSALTMHFGLRVWLIPVAPLPLVLGLLTRRCRRELRLLRGGEMAMGFVDDRTRSGGGDERVAYHFMAAGGGMIVGKSADAGYSLREGSTVPVFYDSSNPRDHVAACGCWFEAE